MSSKMIISSTSQSKLFFVNNLFTAFNNREYYSLDIITPIRFVVILTVWGGSYLNVVLGKASLKVRNCQVLQSGSQRSENGGLAAVKRLLRNHVERKPQIISEWPFRLSFETTIVRKILLTDLSVDLYLITSVCWSIPGPFSSQQRSRRQLGYLSWYIPLWKILALRSNQSQRSIFTNAHIQSSEVHKWCRGWLLDMINYPTPWHWWSNVTQRALRDLG